MVSPKAIISQNFAKTNFIILIMLILSRSLNCMFCDFFAEILDNALYFS